MYSFFLNKILLPIGSVFFSGDYSSYLKQWKSYDAMSSEALEQVQKEKLAAILKYALAKSPYYRNLSLPPEASLKDFPILTKGILREKAEAIISEEFKKENLEKNHSSGSSGVQSFTYMTFDHKFYLRALQTHWWSWGGYKPGERLIQTGISPKRTFPKKLKDIFFRTNYVEAFALNRKTIEDILHRSENKNPKHLAGYPSALNEMALTAISEDKVYHFNSLISYGDKLYGQHKKNFARAFQNPIIVNTYGCAEGLHMACKVDQPYYYIMSPHVFLEIVDDGGNPVKDGERGHILVTCLTNYAMPLIRYKLGDLGIMLPKEKYPKNVQFNYPLLQEITGRETDVIKIPNGNTLIVHSFTGIIEFYEEIKQFKAIQIAKDKITIEYMLENNEKLSLKAEKEISEKLRNLTDNSMEISLTQVKVITASPSGKPQIIEIRSTT
ncbi:AMP-binding protein [Aequorivita capsosiphonis]|uniref:AMP-binding protein n=1 Tax=Aequorivita capsosiphonis TaxID=487317 RepID=UPI00047C5F62|nr:AMP-binding protein [Aequorivita capsosiphonis]